MCVSKIGTHFKKILNIIITTKTKKYHQISVFKFPQLSHICFIGELLRLRIRIQKNYKDGIWLISLLNVF